LGPISSTTEPGAVTTGSSYNQAANPIGVNVRSAPPNSSSGGTTAGDVVSTFFESGFGMASLVEGLIGLFSGGSSTPPPLEPYQMPSSIGFESVETAHGLSAGSYDQMGHMRAIPSEPNIPSGGGTPAPQITVNVQTMDAQSFLDHSGAIAEAVRGAMLNLSSINDVVNDL
jgi:hypothetical protein